jgi:glycosyltransferase involved in cell wall biosynthesis
VAPPASLRIGLFTNNYLPMLGGVSRAVETLRLGLRAAGHEAVVVSPRPRAGARGRPHQDPAGVLRVPALPAPTYPDFTLPLPLGPRLSQAVRALDLDVFHAHHPFLLGATARRLAREAGRPLVFTYHTRYDKYAHYVPLPRPLVTRLALRWSLAFATTADLVVAPSEAVAVDLRARGLRRPVAVVPTGLDLGRFRPVAAHTRRAARRALGLPLDGRLLLYVGRLDREKNLPLLIEAFASLVGEQSHLRLVLVGQGTQARAFRALVARRGLAGRVHFGGGVAPSEVTRYYQAADVFTFTSTTETQGLSVLEAMACGLPVVAIRASGVEEAVLDGVNGLLVAEDPGVFAAAVREVLEDPHLAAKLAAGARERVQAFAAPALITELVSHYRRVRRNVP